MAKGMINPVMDTEEARIAEQLATAAALRKQGFSGNTGGGYQGGKVYMVGSPLGNIAAGLAGIYSGEKAREAQGGLEQARRQEREEFLGSMPSPTQTVSYDPVNNPGTGPFTEFEQRKSPLQHAKEMQQWGTKAMNIPGMENLGGAVLQQAITAPQREADALQKVQDRIHEIQLKAAEGRISKQEADERMATLQLQLKQMGIDNAKLIASMRIGAAGEKAAKPDMRIVDTVDDDGNPVKKVIDLNQMKPGDTMGKPADAATKKAIIESNVGIGNIDRAIELIDAKPSALGPQYKVPGAEIAGQYLDPEGVPARAAVSNVGSLKLHDRSGAAVTVSEFPRLAPFIPTAGDSPKAAKDKLNGLKAEYELIKQEWAAGTNGSILGGKPKAKADKALPAATAPKASSVAPGTKGMHKGRPVVMGTDGEWKYED
jgi:hypothetical protein